MTKSTKQDVPLVAIGTSAGGLKALRVFFQNMPDDVNFALVVVQHLAPNHPTLMPELLSKYTKMKVKQAKHREKVKKNVAYFIPPNTILAIEGSYLHVAPPKEARGRRTPIDHFFKSMAQNFGDNSVGIIMSGTGSDGTMGIKAIKEAGGLLIVQTPESTKYDSMPRSAIATGLVDFVLELAIIPKKLVEYFEQFSNPSLKSMTNNQHQILAHLEKICHTLHEKTGHDFGQYKKNTPVRRIQRRMVMLQISDAQSYQELLRTSQSEAKALLADFLIGVTYFFRDPEVFKYLEKNIIPKILKDKKSGDKVRFWSAGCASGEEAYSLAILAKEYLKAHDANIQVQVFATDIDESAIAKARTGKYAQGIADHISPERLQKYFIQEQDSSYQVIQEIREMCLFSTHDLIQEPPFSQIDLLSCRNLLIYLDQDLQKKVIPIFNYALRPNAYLMLGTTENVSGYAEGFEEVDKKFKVFTCKKPQMRAGLHLPPSTSFPNRFRQLQSNASIGLNLKKRPLESEVHKLVIEELAPPAVVVDRHYQIYFIVGDIEKYLKISPGVPNNELLKMAREEIAYDLRTALSKAVKANLSTYNYTTHFIEVEEKSVVVKIQIKQISCREYEEQLYLVSFHQIPTQSGPYLPHASSEDPQMIQHLEAELRSTKEHLQTILEDSESIQEELKSSNEELLSMNEELQSTNEELQTSQEELQSVNEELETVNSELNLKVDELDKANSDLQNLFSNIRVGIIFLDNDHQILKFTPEIKGLIPLTDLDINRGLKDFTSNLQRIDLSAEIDKVLKRLTTREFEVKHKSKDQWFIIRIAPYRSVKNVIHGVVMTFSDVTKIKEAEIRSKQINHDLLLAKRSLVQERDLMKRILDANTDGWWEYYVHDHDHEHKQFFYNERLLVLLGRENSPHQVNFESWKQLIHPDDLQSTLSTLKKHIESNGEVPFYKELRYKHLDGSDIWVMCKGITVKEGPQQILKIYGVQLDVTKLKKLENKLKEANKQLQEKSKLALNATKVKNIFIANMSHEVRTPISAILGFSEILEGLIAENCDPKEIKFYVDRIKHNSSDLERLIGDILDVAKMEAGKIHFEYKRFNLKESIDYIASRYAQKAHSKNLQFQYSWDPSIKPYVKADEARINQIFNNLLSNAVKYTQEGNIELTLKREALHDNFQDLKLVIKDTGRGVKEENIKRLFGPFERGDIKEKDNISGTGIGLFLVKKIVGNLNGQITFENRRDQKGCIVTIQLRIPYLNVIPSLPTEKMPLGKGLENIKILIVEDNEDLRMLAEIILQNEGASTHSVENGKLALEMLRREHYDVVLMDLLMPEMDGFETISEIRNSKLRYHKVVALTAHAMKGELERCLDAGFDSYLPKPIVKEKLIMEIIRLTKMKMANENEIIYVEDNPQDYRIFNRCLDKSKLTNDLVWLDRGAKLIAYLQRVKRGERKLPSIILIDISLPDENGLDLVEKIRDDHYFQRLPVIGILTNSDEISDVRKSITSRADGFKVKPDSMEEYVKFLNGLKN